jgi:predicted Zn-dependent peptidase
MAEALGILGSVVSHPDFNQQEFNKLKKRELDRVSDSARTSGRWAASMILYRDLFTLPADRHPYASFDATAADVQKITLEACRSFHKKYYVPKNAFVVVAGDTTPEAAKTAVERAFGGWKGGEAPVQSFTDPVAPERVKITLVDRPKSSQSDIYVGALGPSRADASWASFAVSNQILGGGVAGRLFLDVREKQSLAYNTRSSLVEVAHGPAPMIAYAGTQTAKTGLALKAVLDNLDKLGTSEATATEVETATRYLSDVFATKLETVGALADELVQLHSLGLPDDYDDGYRKELRDVTAPVAAKSAAEHVRPGHAIVVVAGDADVIGPMLSHFGEVKVVDPAKNFERSKTIPLNADAPLEVPRVEGR